MPETVWRSPEGRRLSQKLAESNAPLLETIATIDALGHRLLQRMAVATNRQRPDELVGLALTRRAVTCFAGLRVQAENSLVEPAKLQMRALFEIVLAIRYLNYGTRKSVGLGSESASRVRLTRAKYYIAAAIRNDIHYRLAHLQHRFGRRAIGRALRNELQDGISERLRVLKRDFAAQNHRFGPIGSKPNKYFDSREWYSFGFRKPPVNSVWALAKRLGWSLQYAMFYQPLSGLVHPTGIDRDLQFTASTVTPRSVYMNDAFESVANWACIMHFFGLKCVAGCYHPGSMPDIRRVETALSSVIGPLDTVAPDAWF